MKNDSVLYAFEELIFTPLFLLACRLSTIQSIHVKSNLVQVSALTQWSNFLLTNQWK